MQIVVCIDDRYGMLFNNRRLSSDAAVIRRIQERHTGRLLMNSYSAKLFAGMDIIADEQFLQIAQQEDTCFVEDLDFLEYLQNISAITVYRWNRHYPSDTQFPHQLLAGWNLHEMIEFSGNSHITVTEERYIR